MGCKRAVLIILASAPAIIIVALGSYFAGRNSNTPAGPFETALVTRVVDGDTIEIEGGRTVRYIGIDTPETVHPSKPIQCFGPEATQRNRELVEGKTVELLGGTENEDKYGRLLRYVFVDGVFVNAELVTEGYARQAGYGAEKRFQQVFVQLEQYSKNRNAGLWAVCPE